MIVRSLSVVGPTGDSVLEFGGDGLSNADGCMWSPYAQVSWPLLAASVSSYIWTCISGVWRLEAVTTKITVSGGGSAAIMLTACSGVTAVADGVDQLDAVIDLQETAPAAANGVLIAEPTLMYPGDSLGLEFSGTLTGLVGALTVLLARVQ